MSDFQPLEVVGRGSETQLQVTENLNKSGFRIRIRIRIKYSRWTDGWWKQQTVAEHRAYVINIGKPLSKVDVTWERAQFRETTFVKGKLRNVEPRATW